MKAINALFGAAALMVVSHAALASPINLLVNGGFEDPVVSGAFATYGAGSGALTGWTIESGSVDHIGSYWQAQEGNQSLDMAGNELGAISQTFATTAGTKYDVSFWIAGNPDANYDKWMYFTMTGGVTSPLTPDLLGFVQAGNDKTNMGWVQLTYSFVANNSGLAKILFTDWTLDGEGTYFGTALDNVSVSAVPLPAALPLFGAGLAAFGVFARRRRTRAAV